MQISNDKTDKSNDEIDIRELLSLLWKGRWLIILFVSFCTLISSVIALSLPNIYKSDVLLSPVSENSGLKVGTQIGGLAALAGVNLGGDGGDKTSMALEIIKSRDFLAKFIRKYDLKVQIMAAKNWSVTDNTLSYDENIYDIQNKVWVRQVSAPFKPEPSLLETIHAFSKMFSVSRDKVSGMVNVSVEFLSPNIAKEWVTLLVKEINDEMRRRDLEEAESSIAYLNIELDKTNLSDMRTMLFSLIEEQTKTIMLANVRSEYILETVDSAVVPELKVKPKRTIIVGVGFCLGLLLGGLFVVIRYFNTKNN